MRKLVYSFVILLGLVVGAFGFASSASATEPTSGSSIVESTSNATALTSSSNTSVNGVSVRSKTKVVSYVQANGATKAQMKPKKIRLSKRMALWTSYRNTAGHEVWHLKTYPRGKLLVWGKDGWYHDPLCYNKVKYKTKKSVPSSRKLYGAIKVVKSFTFTVTSTSKANGHASAKAHAWCKTDYSEAEATGSGSSSYATSTSATGTGSSWMQATNRARSSSANKLWQKITSLTELKMTLKTQAEGKATAAASAKVTCTTPPPPPSYDAPSVSANASACVKPGESTGVVTVNTVNNNDTAVNATFKLAGKPDQTKSVAANSSASVQFTGLAPGSYSGSVSFGAPVNKSAAFNVTVNVCDVPPPYECPPNTKWTDIDKDGKKEEGECFEAPVFVEFREFNDLYRSLPGTPTTMNHFVTVDTPAGHSFSVTWSTVWGSFATPTKTGQDGVEVGNTYTAPSEVPPAHTDAGLAAGYDKITVTVTDNVTGQKITRSSAPFRIKEWPTTP